MNTEQQTIPVVTDPNQKASSFFTIPAKVVSYLFHPLFIPTYFFLFLVYQFRYEFAGVSDFQLNLKIFSTFWMTAFFPAFAVFLLWRTGLVSNIYLRTRKERIIPFFITMFFYWWMFYLGRNLPDQPIVLKPFYLGIFITTFTGVVINNYMKISLHAIAMGSVCAAIILTAFYYRAPLGLAISIAALLTGLVCTCRLILREHNTTEIYTGLILGVICQFIGFWAM